METSTTQEQSKPKKPRKSTSKPKAPKRPLPKDKWWLNFNEDGSATCMVFTTKLDVAVKLDGVTKVAEYSFWVDLPPYAFQYAVADNNKSMYELLELLNLSENDRDETYELPKRKKRIRKG